MVEKISKNDFIEIEFTGKVKGGETFDSNIKEDLKQANLNLEPKPFIFSVGQGMFMKSVDDFLIGKNIGENYDIELTPEKAFGKRNPSLIKIIPIKVFNQQKFMPRPGMAFNFDGQIGKIISVSGGRVITDFNNPLAGKDIIYIQERTKALIEFFTRKELKFEIKDKNLTVYADKQFSQFLNLFKDKFKEILELDLITKEESEEKKEEKKEESIQK
jgi:FKBP-type peptidyl-prolyl cis-trans isomerase 2